MQKMSKIDIFLVKTIKKQRKCRCFVLKFACEMEAYVFKILLCHL